MAGLTTTGAFQPTPPVSIGAATESMRLGVRLHAFAGLARKMKEKEIAGLREASAELLESRASGATATDEIATLLRKKVPGSLSLIAEYRRKGQNLGSFEQLPPKIISHDFRDAGAEVVAVLLDSATGGCTIADAEEIIAEQNSARGDFPGPSPLIVHDMIIDEVQLAQAAAIGAKGVLLSAAVLGERDLGSMLKAATEYGLEAIVEVKNQQEIALAKSLDFGIRASDIMAISGVSVDTAIELLPQLPEKAVKVVFIPSYNDKQLIEAEDAWRLRDYGCNCVWASEVLFKFGYQDGEHCYSVIKAIKSKGSVKYARASGAYNGMGEGAKEFLGTICD